MLWRATQPTHPGTPLEPLFRVQELAEEALGKMQPGQSTVLPHARMVSTADDVATAHGREPFGPKTIQRAKQHLKDQGIARGKPGTVGGLVESFSGIFVHAGGLWGGGVGANAVRGEGQVAVTASLACTENVPAPRPPCPRAHAKGRGAAA